MQNFIKNSYVGFVDAFSFSATQTFPFATDSRNLKTVLPRILCQQGPTLYCNTKSSILRFNNQKRINIFLPFKASSK